MPGRAMTLRSKLYAGMACWAAACIAIIAYSATANTLLQLNTPDHLRGRVMSIYFLLFAGTTPIGGFLTGLAANHIGVPETLMLE